MKHKWNRERLKRLKQAKKSSKVWVITYNDNFYYDENGTLKIFENEKLAYDFLLNKDIDYDVITMWLNNVEVW